MKALSILILCPKELPLEVLSQAIGTSTGELRQQLSQHPNLVSGSAELWSIKDHSSTNSVQGPPELLAAALDALLAFIRKHKKELIVRSQADNAIELGKSCVEHKPKAVAPLFDVIQTILKRRGDKRLVLKVARLSLAAARRKPRGIEEAKQEALTRICGEAWVLQRINRLKDARAAAEDSLRIGMGIPWDRNTAFCKKCLGRLLRIEAGQEKDRTKKHELLSDSEQNIEEAIGLFATVEGVGPNHKEIGDCYSLLARTRLFAGKPSEAAKTARKARDYLTDESDKDYLDWCLLMGDLEAAASRYQDAESFYEEVLRKHEPDDAEKSEIVARAYLALARARLAMDKKSHAIADFEHAADIWRRLKDVEWESKAQWEKIKAKEELSQTAISELEKETYPVRVEAYRLHKLSDQGTSETRLSRRSARSKTGWKQLIQEARQNVVVEEEVW